MCGQPEHLGDPLPLDQVERGARLELLLEHQGGADVHGGDSEKLKPPTQNSGIGV